LARELHDNFNNDIVRHASMILRDEGRGTIRLALRPESLGNVKIRLEMAENKITGHIVVESEEALRAFEREIHSLEQAFKDSGFQGANLEMSLAADGRGADQFQQGEQARALLSVFAAASRYEAQEWAESPPVEAPGLYQRGQPVINMLA
jgi:flagellar hook-length control protein FliK